MNFNTSPIAFFPSRAAQIWRTWFAQRKISVICGPDLLPFYIIDNGNAPSAGELYDPNTDIKVADVDFQNHLLDHDISVEGQTRHIWIYQGEMAGVFGNANPGYYYLKIGSWYSDVFRIGDLSKEYTEINWQFYDDIITADGTPISKHIKYKQIFETPLWHPEYGVEEEGKTNNGIFYAMQQTTKKTSGFSAIVNESQLDCLNLTRMADNIIIKASLNGTTKTLQTNQFEISSKWQSDDVASIECQFDLFSIIRKYQQSNVEPEPLPIPTPPPTPANYYIKGTVEGATNSIQLRIDGTTRTITCTNGAFEFGYDNALTSLSTVDSGWNALNNVDKIMTLDLSECDGLQTATTVVLSEMKNCTAINFGGCTFAAITHFEDFCRNNEKLLSVSIPEGTFAAVYYGRHGFDGCKALTSVSMPKATLKAGADSLFNGCTNLKTINIPLSTFEDDTHTQYMFAGCKSLESITMTEATFADVEYMWCMFQNADGFIDLDMQTHTLDFDTLFPNCTAQPLEISMMFKGSMFNDIIMQTLDLSNCGNAEELFMNSSLRYLTMTDTQFNGIDNLAACFMNCKYLGNSALTLLSTITFAGATNINGMFSGAKGAIDDTLSLSAATFAAATTAQNMFRGSEFTTISIPTATFSNITNANSMFYNCAKLETLTLTLAEFGSVTTCDAMFLQLPKLTTLTLPNSSTWGLSISLTQSSLLSTNSVVNISNWVATVVQEQTIRIHSTAYIRLQNNIIDYATVLSNLNNKNWNLTT